jgi:hypothetical protein
MMPFMYAIEFTVGKETIESQFFLKLNKLRPEKYLK